MQAPTITIEDVEAAERTLETAEALEEYARHGGSTVLDEQKLKRVVGLLAGFHSTLAMIHMHQRKKQEEQNHSLEKWEK